MTDKPKLVGQQERGARADTIINDPLVKEVFDKIEAHIYESWCRSEATDHEGRHNAYLLKRLLDNLKSEFEFIVKTGKEATIQLVNLKQKEEEDARRQEPKPGT